LETLPITATHNWYTRDETNYSYDFRFKYVW